jgi:hypothetical protein
MNARDLEALVRAAARSEDAAPPAEPCPLLERLQEYAAGPLAAAERERVRRHLDGCPACAAEVALAAAFFGPVAEADPEVEAVVARLRQRPAVASDPQLVPAPVGSAESPLPPAPASSGVADLRERRPSGHAERRAPGWRGLALAAGVVLAGGLAFLVGRPAGDPLPPPPEESTVRGSLVVPVGPLGEAADWPTAFRWEPVREARSYRLTVRTVDDRTLLAVTTEASEHPLSPAAAFDRAVTYRWQVVALDERGEVVARSPEVSFRVLPLAEPAPGLPPGPVGQ